MRRKVYTRLLSLCAGALLLSACTANITPPSEEGNPLSGAIHIDGSSTVFPITEAVAEEFRTGEPGVQVTVGVSGTGGGFNKFCRGETDINDASRPIKQTEIDLCKESNIAYQSTTVAYDGLAVLISPKNTWVDHLTVAELKKIWEPEAQNTITRWNQIRSEWPDEEIHLYGPGVASGTFDYFTEAITGKAGKSRGDYTASEDDNVLVQGVSNDQYSLGFFGLAYYSENSTKLKLVPVDGGAGPVLPSEETVKNGTYTPLSRPLFIYFNSVALKKPEVQSFARFYLENAGSFASEVGYIPLTDAEYVTQTSLIEKFIQSLSSDAD